MCSVLVIDQEKISQNIYQKYLFFPVPTCEKEYLAGTYRRALNGSWIDQISNEITDMEDIWDEDQPDGGNLQECTHYNIITGKYLDSHCPYKSCFVCGWHKFPLFTLRGLCTKTKLDSQYILRLDINFGDNVFFFGIENGNIFYNKTKG